MGLIDFLLGLLAGTFGKQAGREFEAWAPRIAKAITSYAACKLDPADRDRYEEEWLAHLHDTPGEIGKIVVALGFLLATRQMLNKQALLEAFLERAIACFSLLLFMPMLTIIVAALLIDDPTKNPFAKRRAKWWADGQEFEMLTFRSGSFLDRFFKRTAINELPMLASAITGKFKLNFRKNWKAYLLVTLQFLDGKLPPKH